jgi:hypothetical protein
MAHILQGPPRLWKPMPYAQPKALSNGWKKGNFITHMLLT